MLSTWPFTWMVVPRGICDATSFSTWFTAFDTDPRSVPSTFDCTSYVREALKWVTFAGPVARFTLVTAVAYLRNPQKLAEKVYGGRFGNPPGRAYDYRGGGWIQTTFLANYQAAQNVTGLPLVAHPELLHDPLTSIEPACAFWKGRGCNELAAADPGGIKARVRVNGGNIGLDDVLARTARIRKVIA